MSATDPASNRRDGLLFFNGSELLELDFSAVPDQTPLYNAVWQHLGALLKLPRPGCDDCGAPATYAHLDEDAAALACDDYEPGGYHVKLAELVEGDFNWVRQIGQKTWGLIGLMRLIGRLEDEEQIRQLREMRATENGGSG